MKTLKILLLALLISSLGIACKKEKKDQPTQTGSNTMHAKVNGIPWQKKACWSCIGGGSGLSRNFDDRTSFYITGEDPDANSTLSLIIPSLKMTGAYELSTRILNYAQLNNYKTGTQRYYTSATNKGSVTITKLDINNKIISGTFEFSAEDEENNKNTIRVTDGWFDISYQ